MPVSPRTAYPAAVVGFQPGQGQSLQGMRGRIMTGTLAGKEPKPGQTHLRAVNRALTDAAGSLTAADEPLRETLRTLARQMDDAGRNPSTRLTMAYLSAQRDLARLLAAERKPARGPNRLEQLRAERERAQREAS